MKVIFEVFSHYEGFIPRAMAQRGVIVEEWSDTERSVTVRVKNKKDLERALKNFQGWRVEYEQN